MNAFGAEHSAKRGFVKGTCQFAGRRKLMSSSPSASEYYTEGVRKTWPVKAGLACEMVGLQAKSTKVVFGDAMLFDLE